MFEKPHILALWSGEHSANSLIFLSLLGRNHTAINQVNFTVWFDGIKFERDKIPLWPPAKMSFCNHQSQTLSCKASCTSGVNSFRDVCGVFSAREILGLEKLKWWNFNLIVKRSWAPDVTWKVHKWSVDLLIDFYDICIQVKDCYSSAPNGNHPLMLDQSKNP